VTGSVAKALGTWGIPHDAAARGAVVLAVACAVWAAARARADLSRPPRAGGVLGAPPLAALKTRHFLALAAFVAALVSVFWMAAYLRGGPRIIDASTYFLQGRAMNHGLASWDVAEPTASFRGRFIFYREPGVGGGIFPPGYPALLSLGFALGAPMIVGPLIAGAIVVATWALARELALDSAATSARAESIARAAALLSVVCACLRYHTADTMAHGAAALLLTCTLAASISARRTGSGPMIAVAGLALGLLAATRPVSALSPALAAAALVTAGRPRRLVGLGFAALPGLLLFAWAAKSVSGRLASPQHLYYAVSDGPAHCYRWGFGAGVGCLHEHGDFVLARMGGGGYGLWAALGTTARRMHAHALDAFNAEPLFLVTVWAIVTTLWRGPRAARVTALVVLAHVVAYAPFYFDGSYPGGGARMFADVLPLEHALVAAALVHVAPRRLAVGTKAAALVALCLLGFGVRASFEHQKLATRDGGRPMYEPDLVARYGVKTGLVFVDSDHAFALAHDPSADAEHGVVVARLREDARDRMLYERLHNPPTYLYRFNPSAAETADPSVVPWAPPELGAALRFEAEAEWPAVAQRGGFAVPAWTDKCASGAQALALVPEGAAAETEIELPVAEEGELVVTPRITRHARHAAWPIAVDGGGELEINGVVWSWSALGGASACDDLPGKRVRLARPKARVILRAKGGIVALDRIDVARAVPANRGLPRP
jgi:hypothetical protein